MDKLLDILSEIQTDSAGASATQDTPVSGVEQGAPEVVNPVPATESLKTKLKSLSCESYLISMLGKVKQERVIDRSTALEVFTMLPDGNMVTSAKLTNFPSAHNRQFVLNNASVNPNFISQYYGYILEVIEVLNHYKEQHDQVVTACKTFMQMLHSVLPELERTRPTVVINAKQIRLLEDDIESLVYIDYAECGYQKYAGVLDTMYRSLVYCEQVKTLKDMMVFTNISDKSVASVSLKDIYSQLSTIANANIINQNAYDNTLQNLSKIHNQDKQDNTMVHEGMFETIFDMLDNSSRDHALFLPANSVANLTLKLLKYLD